jgi:hypothetical protein
MRNHDSLAAQKRVRTTVAPVTAARRAIKKSAVHCGLCLAALLPIAALAGQEPHGPLMLRFRFTPNEISRYQTSVQMLLLIHAPPNPPQPKSEPLRISMVQEQKVRKVTPDGGGEIVTTLQNGVVNGRPIPSKRLPLVVMRFSPQGKILASQGVHAVSPLGDMIGNAFTSNGTGGIGIYLRLPTAPVKPGDTWTQPVAMPHGVGSGTVKCTFVSVENIGRYKTARIHTAATIPMKMQVDAAGQPTQVTGKVAAIMIGTYKMEGENNLAIAEGKLVRAAGSGDIQLFIKPKVAANAKPKPRSPNKPNQSKTPSNAPHGVIARIQLTVAMELIQ